MSNGIFDISNILNMLDGEEFDERPVTIEDFVQDENYLGLPPLSVNQYTMIKASSQIYKLSTLVNLYGFKEGTKRHDQTCTEVIMQLGKGCVTLDTELYNARTGHWIKAKDLMSEDNTVVSLDRVTGKTSGEYSTEVFHSVTEMTYEVTTSKGFVIKVNAGHKFVTPGFVMQPLFELNVGDKVALPTNLPVLEEVAIDEREVRLLGYWLGDGMMPLDIPGKRIINMDFSENDVNAMNEYIAIHESYGDNPTVTKHPKKKMWFVRSGMKNCPATLEIARKHGLWGTRANTKKIPGAVWSLPLSQLQTFISRLWGTDGCVYMKKSGKKITPVLEYCSVSEGLASDLQRLLARCGVIAGLRSRVPAYTYNGERRYGQTAYYLTVADRDGYMRFHESITMTDKNTNDGYSMFSQRSSVGRYENDVYWDSIKSIKEVGTEELFTVTAPAHENYVANMIMNGNSGK